MVGTIKDGLTKLADAAEAQRKSWEDPEVRARRVAGIRRFHADRKRKAPPARTRRIATPAETRLKAVATHAQKVAAPATEPLPDFKTPCAVHVEALAEPAEILPPVAEAPVLRVPLDRPPTGGHAASDYFIQTRAWRELSAWVALPIVYEDVAEPAWNPGNAVRNSAIFLQRGAAARCSGGVSTVYGA